MSSNCAVVGGLGSRDEQPVSIRGRNEDETRGDRTDGRRTGAM
ncbi:hypothetical protein [Halococcus thailandensis]|nr:hypothetical protein [Halococcus thailandensis]